MATMVTSQCKAVRTVVFTWLQWLRKFLLSSLVCVLNASMVSSQFNALRTVVFTWLQWLRHSVMLYVLLCLHGYNGYVTM
jgi:hypothetical protein